MVITDRRGSDSEQLFNVTQLEGQIEQGTAGLEIRHRGADFIP